MDRSRLLKVLLLVMGVASACTAGTKENPPAPVNCGAACAVPPGCEDGVHAPGEFCGWISSRKFPAGFSVRATGDLNGDGLLDIIGNGAQDAVTSHLASGDGSFQLKATVPNLRGDVLVADFTGDRKVDLVVGPNDSKIMMLLPGRGDGTFSAATTININLTPLYGVAVVAAGDLNSDGKTDLVVEAMVNSTDTTLRVFINNGDGTFTFGAETPFPSGYRALSSSRIRLGNVVGSKEIDLVVSAAGPLSSTYAALVFTGLGGGAFSAGKEVTAYHSAGAPECAWADFNADGLTDFACGVNDADAGTVVVQTFISRGDGGFSVGGRAGEGVRVIAGDLNGDSRPELVATSRNSTERWCRVRLYKVDLQGAPELVSSFRSDAEPGGSECDAVIGQFDDGAAPDVLITAPEPELMLAPRPFSLTAPALLAVPGDAYGELSAFGDFDGDGKGEVAGTHRARGNSELKTDFWRLGADETWSRVASIDGGFFLAEDLTKDGRMDLLVSEATTSSQTLTSLVAVGGFNFRPVAYPAPLMWPSGRRRCVDLSGEGIPDLVAMDPGGGLFYLLGDGDGGFTRKPIPAGFPTAFVSFVDVDGLSPHEVVALGNETETLFFGADAGVKSPQILGINLVADMNADGKEDLIGAGLTIALSLGDGTFPVTGTFPNATCVMAVHDVNGDGKPDALGCKNVFFGQGDGKFTVAGSLSAPVSVGWSPSREATFADVNGDGAIDVIDSQPLSVRWGIPY